MLHKDFMVIVNLGASDKLLMSEFKAWLKKTRQAVDVPIVHREYTQDDFNKWHSERLLAYLDLTFWSKTHYTDLTNPQLTDLLFPLYDGNENIEEKVRKTISKNAAQLMNEQAVLSLVNQVSKTPNE